MLQEDFERPRGAMAHLALACTVIAGTALLCIALVQLWQVFTRYVLNDSPGWTEPVTLLLLSTAMMFAAAAGVRGNAHFGFFVLLHALPPRAQRVLQAFAALVAAGIGGLLLVCGAQLAAGDWTVAMPGTQLPQGMLYVPLSLGGGLMALFALERVVTVLRAPAEG
ncbi:TRAP transporter small permease [Chiayiivirga flava]|uniref:TRAP transporter small permease protein n=1 Tax=Chiayiivirga flava TaxID=659595 RepID=A0A7W8D9A8_9GAMM|nr:TRAP transporter small permease [Chiayiivirga flava]MBB5208936.1 TRAP-type C4-dicarboxylate transport system permease small subunit [Chiayiivirga flava]